MQWMPLTHIFPRKMKRGNLFNVSYFDDCQSINKFIVVVRFVTIDARHFHTQSTEPHYKPFTSHVILMYTWKIQHNHHIKLLSHNFWIRARRLSISLWVWFRFFNIPFSERIENAAVETNVWHAFCIPISLFFLFFLLRVVVLNSYSTASRSSSRCQCCCYFFSIEKGCFSVMLLFFVLVGSLTLTQSILCCCFFCYNFAVVKIHIFVVPMSRRVSTRGCFNNFFSPHSSLSRSLTRKLQFRFGTHFFPLSPRFAF